MKTHITRKLSIQINATLDSSEAVMFNQGGQHKEIVPMNDILSPNLLSELNSFHCDIEFIFSVQLSKNSQHRHNFIMQEAYKAKDLRDESINRDSLKDFDLGEDNINKFMDKYFFTKEEAERAIPKVKMIE